MARLLAAAGIADDGRELTERSVVSEISSTCVSDSACRELCPPSTISRGWLAGSIGTHVWPVANIASVTTWDSTQWVMYMPKVDLGGRPRPATPAAVFLTIS